MRRLLPILTLVALAAVAAAWFTDRLTSGPDHGGGELSPGADLERAVEPFELSFANGDPFTRADLEGDWDLVFFGYTYCPDVCPTTLQQIERTLDRLAEEDRPAPRVTYISVDPDRDKLERLGEYVGFFHDDIRAATGARDELDAMVDNFGVVYRLNLDEGENYTVDHSAAILVVDPDGVIRAALAPPHDPERVIPRLEELGALD